MRSKMKEWAVGEKLREDEEEAYKPQEGGKAQDKRL